MDSCQRCEVAIEGGTYCQTCGPILARRKDWKNRFIILMQVVVVVAIGLANKNDYSNGLWQDLGWHQMIGKAILYPVLCVAMLEILGGIPDAKTQVDKRIHETGAVAVAGVIMAAGLLDGWWIVLASVVWFYVVMVIGRRINAFYESRKED